MFLHLVVTQMDSWNEGSCNGLLPWLFNCQQHPSAGIKAPSGNPHRRIYSALAQDPLKSIGVSMGAEWLTEVCTVIVSQLQCFQFPGCHRSFRLHEFPPPDWSVAIHPFLCPTSADRHDGGWCDLDWNQDGGIGFEFNAHGMNCNSWSFCLMECWSWHDGTSLSSEQLKHLFDHACNADCPGSDDILHHWNNNVQWQPKVLKFVIKTTSKIKVCMTITVLQMWQFWSMEKQSWFCIAPGRVNWVRHQQRWHVRSVILKHVKTNVHLFSEKGRAWPRGIFSRRSFQEDVGTHLFLKIWLICFFVLDVSTMVISCSKMQPLLSSTPHASWLMHAGYEEKNPSAKSMNTLLFAGTKVQIQLPQC